MPSGITCDLKHPFSMKIFYSRLKEIWPERFTFPEFLGAHRVQRDEIVSSISIEKLLELTYPTAEGPFVIETSAGLWARTHSSDLDDEDPWIEFLVKGVSHPARCLLLAGGCAMGDILQSKVVEESGLLLGLKQHYTFDIDDEGYFEPRPVIDDLPNIFRIIHSIPERVLAGWPA